VSIWTALRQNLNNWINYSRLSIRSNEGTYFDAHRFLMYDVAGSYLDLVEKFTDFKKVYLTSFSRQRRLEVIST
jgi:hypothetical protein